MPKSQNSPNPILKIFSIIAYVAIAAGVFGYLLFSSASTYKEMSILFGIPFSLWIATLLNKEKIAMYLQGFFFSNLFFIPAIVLPLYIFKLTGIFIAHFLIVLYWSLTTIAYLRTEQSHKLFHPLFNMFTASSNSFRDYAILFAPPLLLSIYEYIFGKLETTNLLTNLLLLGICSYVGISLQFSGVYQIKAKTIPLIPTNWWVWVGIFCTLSILFVSLFWEISPTLLKDMASFRTVNAQYLVFILYGIIFSVLGRLISHQQ